MSERGESGPAVIARRLRTQGRECERLGAPTYAALLERAAQDAEAGGLVWDLLGDHAHERGETALALRMLGATHLLALTGRAPALAAFYPSCGGDPAAAGPTMEPVWDAFRDVLAEHAGFVRSRLGQVAQTNEVGRAAALLGGFLTAGADTGLPLRVLEVGASAGLLLRWDHYRYADAFGPANSPVHLHDAFAGGGRPPFAAAAAVTVAERRGCDLQPMDVRTEVGQAALAAYVWPDHVRRMALLRNACAVARQVPVAIDQAPAADWLAAQLAEPVPGMATVVYHSVVMQYLDPAERQRVGEVIEDAGARATSEAPVARLSFEPVDKRFEVRLRLWPGRPGGPGGPSQPPEHLLATAPAHGLPTTWFGSGAT